MMPIDLHSDTPERLIAESSPPELLDAIQVLETWDEHALKVTDYLFNAWVLDICMRPADEEGLRDLELALHVALERTQATPPEPWRNRWRTYVDLLHGRALRFTDAAEIDALWQRKHIPELVALLSSTATGMTQTTLRLRMNNATPPVPLSQERISQLLRHLEEHGLITRMRSGRENLVELSSAGRAALDRRTVSSGARVPVAESKPTEPQPTGRQCLGDPNLADANLLREAA